MLKCKLFELPQFWVLLRINTQIFKSSKNFCFLFGIVNRKRDCIWKKYYLYSLHLFVRKAKLLFIIQDGKFNPVNITQGNIALICCYSFTVSCTVQIHYTAKSICPYHWVQAFWTLQYVSNPASRHAVWLYKRFWKNGSLLAVQWLPPSYHDKIAPVQ